MAKLKFKVEFNAVEKSFANGQKSEVRKVVLVPIQAQPGISAEDAEIAKKLQAGRIEIHIADPTTSAEFPEDGDYLVEITKKS